jgi:CelD/BcsL family acetyltransferase involved in cellulose biosynthesis
VSGAGTESDLEHTLLVTRLEEVSALEDEWRAIAEARGNPFMTPEWFASWLHAYGAGWEPLIVGVRKPDGGLVGLLPLVRPPDRRATLRSCRCDHFHPVSALADEERVATASSAILTARGPRPKQIVLDNVDSGARWWAALADGASNLAIVRRPETESPYARLEGLSWQTYLDGRSRSFRSQLGRKMRALREGHVVQVRRTTRPEELSRDLDSLFKLHALRWIQRNERSTFGGDQVRRFHERFARITLERGWLRLYQLEVDGAPIAAVYGWLLGGRWTYLQGGFDPAWARYSPTLLLIAETIREAIEQGASEYDLMRGGQAYKYRFATGARRSRSVVLVRRGDPAHVSALARARARGAWERLSPESRARVRRAARRAGLPR